MRRRALVAAHGSEVALPAAMNFASLVNQVRLEFTEMPNLELTMAQAVRLWHLGADDCRYVLDSLVDIGFYAGRRSGPWCGRAAACS
jgi:hypothetical protein